MANRHLNIYNYNQLDQEIKTELYKINEYIVDLIENKKHYHNALKFLKVVASKFEELGIKSDIYYKISSVKNTINTKNMHSELQEICQRLFDVYLECIKQKDYRNAVKMLDYYKLINHGNKDFSDLHLASVYIKLSLFEEASTLLDNLKISCSEYPDYYTSMIELAYKKKEYHQVISLLPFLEKYDGYTRFEYYILAGKSYYLLGDSVKANSMFNLAKNIINDDEFFNRISASFKSVAIDDSMAIHPSRRELYIQHQIALDRKDYEKAAACLEKVIDISDNPKLIKKDRKKLTKIRRKMYKNQ